MQLQWEKIGILMFLGSLRSDFTSARSQGIESLAVNLLSKTYQLFIIFF